MNKDELEAACVIHRDRFNLAISKSLGVPALLTETLVTLAGWRKAQTDGSQWRIAGLRYRWGDQGGITSCELEAR